MVLSNQPALSTTQLPEAVLELFDASISANTKRAYATALHRLQIYLNDKPVTDAALATYLTDLFGQGKAPATAAMVVAAVRFQARLYDNKEMVVGPATERALAGFRRKGVRRGTGQVKGVRWEQADAAAAAAVVDQSLRGLRDAAIIATASDAMLRISELSALLLSDLSIEAVDGSGRLLIQKSKTDQEQKGKYLYLGKPTVGHIQSWIVAANITKGYLFRRIRRGNRVCSDGLGPSAFVAIIKKRLVAAGVKGRISGHSLRVGSAQSLATAGASLVDMQNAGRWRSPQMPAAYSEAQMAGRGAVARLRYNR